MTLVCRVQRRKECKFVMEKLIPQREEAKCAGH